MFGRVIQPNQYVPEPHPNYDRDEPFLPGYRGHGGAFGEEKWDPDLPPCIPSDERPENIFGSSLAAKAVAAAAILEESLPQGDRPRPPTTRRTRGRRSERRSRR